MSILLGRFHFFRKFAEIFANECLSPVSTTSAINLSPVTTTPAINLLPVTTTPVIRVCILYQIAFAIAEITILICEIFKLTTSYEILGEHASFISVYI